MSSPIVDSDQETTQPGAGLSLSLPGPTVLRGVSYRQYVTIRKHAGNHGLRLTYHDGTLEIMSPEYAHELTVQWLGVLIRTVGEEFGLPYHATGSTTFRIAGEARNRGFGKEPDQSFYFANAAKIVRKREIDLDAGDPPPDLWIEVDNRATSAGKLPLYAALGVPEIWRYRIKTGNVWFGKLVEGEYESIERSLALPMLSPSLVAEILRLGTGLIESEWRATIRTWIGERLRPSS